MKNFKKILFLLFLIFSAIKINAMFRKQNEQNYESDDEKKKKHRKKIRLLPPQLRKSLQAMTEINTSRPPSPTGEYHSNPTTPVTEIDLNELLNLLEAFSLPGTPDETTMIEDEMYRSKRKLANVSVLIKKCKRKKGNEEENEDDEEDNDDEEMFDCEEE
ncbi:MAG: hypothetical protein ABIA74_05020 [bacterium]